MHITRHTVPATHHTRIATCTRHTIHTGGGQINFAGAKFAVGNFALDPRKNMTAKVNLRGTSQVLLKPQVPISMQGRPNDHTQPVMCVQLISGPDRCLDFDGELPSTPLATATVTPCRFGRFTLKIAVNLIVKLARAKQTRCEPPPPTPPLYPLYRWHRTLCALSTVRFQDISTFTGPKPPFWGIKRSGVDPPLSSSRACLSRPSLPSQFAACSTGHSIVHWPSVPIPVPHWIGQGPEPGGSGLYRRVTLGYRSEIGSWLLLVVRVGLLRIVCACRGGPHSATHSFICSCRDMGSGGERGSVGHWCVPLPPAAVCCVGP